MSECSITAAQKLRDDQAQHYRSSVSRSYYAAYYAVIHCLRARGTFNQGRNNPDQKQCAKLILNLAGLKRWEKDELHRLLRTLFKMRVAADYLPSESIDLKTAKDALKIARVIISTLS